MYPWPTPALRFTSSARHDAHFPLSVPGLCAPVPQSPYAHTRDAHLRLLWTQSRRRFIINFPFTLEHVPVLHPLVREIRGLRTPIFAPGHPSDTRSPRRHPPLARSPAPMASAAWSARARKAGRGYTAVARVLVPRRPRRVRRGGRGQRSTDGRAARLRRGCGMPAPGGARPVGSVRPSSAARFGAAAVSRRPAACWRSECTSRQ